MNRFKIFAPMLKASLDGDGRRRLHGIASSTIKDRHGDTMTESALMDMERSANNNLTIFLNHSYMVPEDVAGSVERAVLRSHPQDANVHDLTLDIAINESNPRAVSAWEAIQSGTQLGLSIGAMIPEGGVKRQKGGSLEINHVELLETSLVGVPANPRSWVEYAIKSIDGKEIDDEVIVEELTAEDLDHTDDPPEDEPVEETEPEVTPDITDATVNIETPFANISIDTGRGKPATGASQEALSSDPETEAVDEEPAENLSNPWAAIGLSGDPEVEPVTTELQVQLDPAVGEGVQLAADLLRAITRELVDTKKELADAISERDAAVAATKQVLSDTQVLLDRLSKTPIGRRATVREVSDEFASLKAVYGEDFLTLLKKG
jgi:HK97 family phage prohead protease